MATSIASVLVGTRGWDNEIMVYELIKGDLMDPERIEESYTKFKLNSYFIVMQSVVCTVFLVLLIGRHKSGLFIASCQAIVTEGVLVRIKR
ncbi:hypothetical protein QE152_g35983 [Popillia japonica]|uniref:Uncharacterized protein n=1 Tax=Popillia japonica TaxID=7064 RepID=A0AAW1IEJ1_POPJA